MCKCFRAVGFAVVSCFVVANSLMANEILPSPPPAIEVIVDTEALPKCIELAQGDKLNFFSSRPTKGIHIRIVGKTGSDVLTQVLSIAPPKGNALPYWLAAYHAAKPGQTWIEVSHGEKRKSVIPVLVTTPARSGIYGQVTEGPLYPVARQGQQNYRHLPGSLVIAYSASGKEVARTTAGSYGNYRLPLQRGTYRVVAVRQGHQISSAAKPPSVVTVQANRWLKTDLKLDTSIR